MGTEGVVFCNTQWSWMSSKDFCRCRSSVEPQGRERERDVPAVIAQCGMDSWHSSTLGCREWLRDQNITMHTGLSSLWSHSPNVSELMGVSKWVWKALNDASSRASVPERFISQLHRTFKFYQQQHAESQIYLRRSCSFLNLGNTPVENAFLWLSSACIRGSLTAHF